MSTIYLVRHAEYDNPRHILPGRLPVELSEAGIKQTKKLRDYFADKKIAKIYSSEVLRCKQTSEIIADGKICIEFDRRLLEVLSAMQGYWHEDWSFFFGSRKKFGGELNIDVQNRIVNFWENTSFEDGKNYLICSHADPIFFLYQHLSNIPILSEIKKIGEQIDIPDNYPSLGSFYIIEKESEKWKVKELIKQENL